MSAVRRADLRRQFEQLRRGGTAARLAHKARFLRLVRYAPEVDEGDPILWKRRSIEYLPRLARMIHPGSTVP